MSCVGRRALVRSLCAVPLQPLPSLLSIHIRDEMRHGISDTPESLPAAVPRVDPQDRLQNGLSCACFIDSGHFQGMLMQLVPS